MAEFENGQKVRVHLDIEGEYSQASTREGFHLVNVPGDEKTWVRVPESAIQVIEERFEEGAIYSTPKGYHWAYLPTAERHPWVFISGPTDYYYFGQRLRRSEYDRREIPLTKVAPLAQ